MALVTEQAFHWCQTRMSTCQLIGESIQQVCRSPLPSHHLLYSFGILPENSCISPLLHSSPCALHKSFGQKDPPKFSDQLPKQHAHIHTQCNSEVGGKRELKINSLYGRDLNINETWCASSVLMNLCFSETCFQLFIYHPVLGKVSMKGKCR